MKEEQAPLKCCKKCGEHKPFESFHKSNRHRDGRVFCCKACISQKGRAYRARNRAEIVIRKRNYRLANLAKVKQKHKQWRAANASKNKRANREKRETNPALFLLYGARRRAKVKGLPFNLELSDIVVPVVCPVLGIPLVINKGRHPRDNSPTLDQVIPGLGYIKGFARVISWRANRFKSDATPDELDVVAKYARQATEDALNRSRSSGTPVCA